MKNRRAANREMLLLYHFRGTEAGQQILGVAVRMGILCKVVEEEQTEETLGRLLKLPGYPAAASQFEADCRKSAGDDGYDEPAEVLPRQMMVLYGFTGARLDEFLRNMRKSGLSVIPLKAIVTPHNINWTFRQLYEELEREEASYRSGGTES